ncbi:MAG TPA: LodA/GoxA family CTQ-dependent oxidase, partial [Chloroflexota bacterium]
QAWVSGPATPSYTNDVYPILQRARDIHAVRGDAISHHTWADPVYDATDRSTIFGRLSPPGGAGGPSQDMPDLSESPLTATQYAIMQAWKDGTFTQDWVAPPQPAADITPDGLDRAALMNCVGAAFYPGIEAGGIVDGPGIQPIIDPANYVGGTDPLRLNAGALSPGDITQWMALPWQNDFYLCQDTWWPVPRPDEVVREGMANQSWTGTTVGSSEDMVSKWSTLGFVVKQGGDFVEVERCDVPFVALLTPSLDFQDVPQGPMGMSRTTALAVEFEVESSAAVTLEVKAGDGPANARLTLPAASVTVAPTAPSTIALARLWVLYQTGPVGEHISDQLTVTEASSGATWMIPITANTVARKVAVATLVLDRSGSMSEDRGDGQSKHDSVVEASSIMVDVMLEGDAIGVVAFNNTASTPESATTLGPAGDPFDPGRMNTKGILAGPGLTPSGSTSIGAGIVAGRNVLNAAGPGFDVRSLVVLTDGVENTPPWIADVAPQIDDFTYAVGLGTPQNTSAAALQAISGNHGGYLLLTGAVSGDNQFILTKYFLQILAGISNAEIVLDPQGVLLPGQRQEIPFQMTEADAGMDVILLTPFPELVDFRLEAPSASVIEPWRSGGSTGIAYSISQGNSYYRVVLPQQLIPGRLDQAGTWKALLTIGRPQRERTDNPPGQDLFPPRWRNAGLVPGTSELAASVGERGRLPYSLVVHAYSNLSFKASLVQVSYEPGAKVDIHATLAESGLPTRPGAAVWAEVTRPDGTKPTIHLVETEPGQFSGSFVAAVPGIYQCHVKARGLTRRGNAFRREQTLTAGVWYGGDQPSPTGGQGQDKQWCDLLRCLLENKVVTGHAEQLLREAGLDIAQLRRCLEEWCRSVEYPQT